jgi:hypothetical protein
MPTFTRKLSELLNEGFNLGLTDLDYPLYDETYREKLNHKILMHYWNYEIGQETESMFRFSLNRKMNEIMPYYNQLYLSAQLEIDPLLSMKYSDIATATAHATGSGTATESNITDSTGSANSTSDTNSRARSVNSDTPQVMLSPDEDYASGAVNSISDATVNGNTGSTSHEDQEVNNENTRTEDSNTTANRNLLGFNIPATDLLLKFRSTFLNIDMMVIDDLQTLFMQVWDNGDEYFAQEGTLNYVAPSGWPVF